MRTQVIEADTIEGAAERILGELKRSVRSRDNVFYLDGWDGLGASAVLRAVARRFTTTTTSPPASPEFEEVIHIDCSKWESRRALQRAVAEQLDLPAQVMELFDTMDEEDDFRGVARGSRAELPPVVWVMQQHMQNHRFLVVFHNGSTEEIDLATCCGFTLSGYSTSKLLWTFQGRLRVKPRTKVDTAMEDAGTTDVFLSVYRSFQGTTKKEEELWSDLVLQEAAEVVAACRVNTGSRGIIDQPAQVVECFQYMLELCCKGSQSIDYDLDTHGANYLACDGTMYQPRQGDDDDEGLWRSAQALQCEMSLDVDYHQYLPSPHLLSRFVNSKPYWTSPTCGFTLIPDTTIPNGDIFQHYVSKLCVLKLSRCTFDFQSPPFLCCYGLRFLWLDHCQGIKTSTYGAGMEDTRRCFQRLWVLDVRYTDCDQILSAQMLDFMTQLRELNVIGANEWDMGQLQGRLPNIRKLRVKKSRVNCSCSGNDLFSVMKKMGHLEFSGNYTMMSLFGSGESSSNVWCLETVVIVDGSNTLQRVSFNGCTKLKNLHLGGQLWQLHTLDISGTAVKTLDLSTTKIPHLDELYLLDCKKLCAILWPPKEHMKQEGFLALGKLCIDTTDQSREEKDKRGTSTATIETSVAPEAAPHGSRPSTEFGWHISVRDARLLASLEPIYSDYCDAYVEISSGACPTPTIAVGGSIDEGIFKSASIGEQQLLVNLQRQPAPAVYADITMDHLQQASEGDDETLGIMSKWPCLDDPDLPEKRCYIHMQDQMRTKSPQGGEETSTITVPEFVAKYAKLLHVHDCLHIASITSMTSYGCDRSEWPDLEWCRIERCPKLDFVFNNAWYGTSYYKLRTLWASQLLKSRYISTSSGERKFDHLTLLHLDYCPRLIHVLALTRNLFGIDEFSLGHLETLEIAWCGDLREIFPFNADKPDYYSKDFPEQKRFEIFPFNAIKPNYSKVFPGLKRIHLHELPSLQCICGVRMSAPNLETVKIRGCWSLRRLPDIGSSSSNKVVECDCEKEWWDRLEWDDRSQAEHYKPIHPRYYKETLLRGTMLR